MDKSNIWIPGEDNLRDYIPDPKKECQSVHLKGIIRNAVYHKDIMMQDGNRTGAISLTLQLPDGTLRTFPQYKSCYAVKGCRLDQLPPQEGDREMEKLAQSFRSAKGRPIKIEVFKEQL